MLARQTRKVHRSPSYPMISLEGAIDRAKILWEKDRHNLMPKEVVLNHLGYEETSSYGGRVLAALKKFELIEEKNEKFKLTQWALDLAIYPTSDNRYLRALKEIALKPTIYQELFKKYKRGLPSDENLTAELIRGYGFNPRKVKGFIEDYRRTIDFADLYSDKEEDKQPLDTEETGDSVKKEIFTNSRSEFIENLIKLSETSPAVKGTTPLEKFWEKGLERREDKKEITAKAHSYNIPLKSKNKAVITFDRLPVTNEDLNRLKQWIDLMEDPLTEESEDIE